MSEHIYYGAWINWSHGPIIGATLTIDDRSGALLVAFIATFVTLIGASLFKIMTYIFHQARSKSSAQDGLFHQQQVIIRNTASPGSAAWTFLMQGWTWSGKASWTLSRTLPLALFCLVYMIAFTVAAVFSSEITKGPGSARLIIGENCGYWMANDTVTGTSIEAYSKYIANESLAADAYARTCYGGSYDMLSCGKFTKPSINFTSNAKAPCPFAEGMCKNGDNSAYELTTKFDSLYDLGINSRSKDRLQIVKISTCGPIIQNGFTQTVDGKVSGEGRDGDTIYQFMYGPSVLGSTGFNSSDYTYEYNDANAVLAGGYKLAVKSHNAGPIGLTGGWDPVPEINRTDADVSIIFLSQNGVTYAEPVDDPLFGAHVRLDVGALIAGTGDYFSADNYVSTMGCAEQYKVCNPNNNNKCSDAVGVQQLIMWLAYNNDKVELNNIQQAIALRIISGSLTSGTIGQIIFTMAENALQAKDVLVGGTMSQGLPSNQWQREMHSWVNKGLADLQRKTVEFATGPLNVATGSYIYKPWKEDNSDLSKIQEAMCYSQMINDTTDTVSFSILGMAILFSVGGVIILLSLIIDSLVGWFQKRFHTGEHARMCWLLDDKLQLQRYLNQELGHGQWNNEPDSMPSTGAGQTFPTLAVAHERCNTGEKPGNFTSQNTEYTHTAGYHQPAYQNYAPSSPPAFPLLPQAAPVYQNYSKVPVTEETYVARKQVGISIRHMHYQLGAQEKVIAFQRF